MHILMSMIFFKKYINCKLNFQRHWQKTERVAQEKYGKKPRGLRRPRPEPRLSRQVAAAPWFCLLRQVQGGLTAAAEAPRFSRQTQV